MAKENKKIKVFDIINIILMLLFAVIILYPLVQILSTSLSDSLSILRKEIILLPKGININSYKLILSDDSIPRAYWNSIKYAVIGTLVNVVMTIVMAYPLSKGKTIGNKFFAIMVAVTMVFRPGIIPSFVLVSSLGMIDSMWALIIPNAIWVYQLLITRSFFQNIPGEIEESAMIDGASVFRILARIIVPLSKPLIAAITLFYVIGHWNSFFLPMIYLTSDEKYPLQLVLRNMIILSNVESRNMDPAMFANSTPAGLKSATIILSILPMVAVYPFIQKHFVKGVMIGAVKG